MNDPKVSVIIVNWNGKHHLERCIPTLLGQNYKNIEIVIIDNGSTDGSVEYIHKNVPNVLLVKNSTNLGFAESNNLGFNVSTGELILFLNNDTEVTSDFLDILVTQLKMDTSLGGVQPKIMLMKDPKRFDSVGSFLTSTGFLYHYGYMQLEQDKFEHDIELYTAKGACMLFRRKIIEQVGLFDKRYFAYFEESDFCHRVWLLGYKIKYIHTAKIFHLGGGTSNSMDNAFIQYHSFKNRIATYLKNLGFIELFKILPMHILLCEAAAVMFILKGKINIFIAINHAIFWNITNFIDIMASRRATQKFRKFKDKDLMKIIKKQPTLEYYKYLFQNKLHNYNDPTII